MINDYAYIYGKHAVAEALRFRSDVVKQVYLDLQFKDEQILSLIDRAKVPAQPLSQKKFPGGLKSDVAHQGIVATISVDALMVDYKQFIKTVPNDPSSALLILGEVQDPHNVGAVIRSAAAFGLKAVLIPPHNQAPVTGTVIKVSAGMAFRIPLVAISNVNAVTRDLKDRGFWVYGLEGEGTVSAHTESFSKPSVFILGNEGSGLRQKTKEVCDDLISIPIHPRCESLNAAAATAVVLSAWSAKHNEALT